MPRLPGADSPPIDPATLSPPAALEALVTRLAPLYRERAALQNELQKTNARLEKISRDIAELEGQLRNPDLH